MMRFPAFLFLWMVAPAQPLETDLFKAGEQGYVTYRIPGLLAHGKTVLAYAEARRDGFGDWADIDVVLRRSTDGGRTWEPMRVLADSGTDTVNNPVAIPGAKEREIHFLYCVNYARVFHIRSTDGGRSFGKPVEITGAFEGLRRAYDWNVIATGPGHGIRLRNGRLLVAVWLSTGGKRHRPSRVSTLYSDDDGKTWNTGDLVPDTLPNPSETYAVELKDGRVMLNIRSEAAEHRRAISVSNDGARRWSVPRFDTALLEPVCMAALIRHPGGGLLFSNPDTLDATYVDAAKTVNRDRKNLTVQWSVDDGATWTAKRVMEPGLSGYSDLAATSDGTILCLFERGGLEKNIFRTSRLSLARFSLDWVKSAAAKK
ncbi:MAG: exo-alpha-sialidase [Acidobacteria bacterium]|nr:exo-alpha-sialidase [Acidobacteriota bacterium]